MAISDEEKIVTVLTAELISKFAFNLGQKISFNHSPDAFGNKLPSCSPDHLLLVDSSHSKYICRYLDMANITYRSELARTEFLSDPDQRLQWQSHSLPTDDLCTENAIMLSRYKKLTCHH